MRLAIAWLFRLAPALGRAPGSSCRSSRTCFATCRVLGAFGLVALEQREALACAGGDGRRVQLTLGAPLPLWRDFRLARTRKRQSSLAILRKKSHMMHCELLPDVREEMTRGANVVERRRRSQQRGARRPEERRNVLTHSPVLRSCDLDLCLLLFLPLPRLGLRVATVTVLLALGLRRAGGTWQDERRELPQRRQETLGRSLHHQELTLGCAALNNAHEDALIPRSRLLGLDGKQCDVCWRLVRADDAGVAQGTAAARNDIGNSQCKN